MSRVIKSAVWQDEPRIVERPVSKRTVTDESGMGEISLQAQRLLLEEKEAEIKKMLADAEDLRTRIYSEAQAEAEKIKNEALQEAEQLRQTAREDGYQTGQTQGYQDGLQTAQQEQAAVLDAVNEKASRTILAAQEEMKSCMVLAERQIAEIIFSVAGKILPQHFLDVPQIILPMVKKALDKIKDQEGIVIRVSPDNYEFVIMAKNEFQAMLTGNEPLQVQADPSLGLGDCIIESLSGSVDARLQTQLELIKKSVQEVIA